MSINRKSIEFFISKQFTLKCQIIHVNPNNPKKYNKETIQLEENKSQYPLCISFDENEIITSDDKQSNAIYFMKDLFDKPTNYKIYNIYQNH